MMRRWWCALVLLLFAGGAGAHLMPEGRGTVKIDRDGVFSAIAVPVSAFRGADADGNGRISLVELNANRDGLLRQLEDLIRFTGEGRAGKVLFQDLLIPDLQASGPSAEADYLVAMQRHAWTSPMPATLTVALPLLERGGRPLFLQAAREGDAETVVLTSTYREHRLFAGTVANLLRFVGLGGEHILSGPDHLLFLLTVLVAAAGWTYRAAVITSFTLAHSVTLTLGALGWLVVPASVAEPLIAASIVLLAFDNLRPGPVRIGPRSALVFVAGLVHGMGFARALGEMGGSGPRWLQLAGFNLGVELGQLLFAGAALLLLAAIRQLLPRLTPDRVRGATSWLAAVVGGVLLIQLMGG